MHLSTTKSETNKQVQKKTKKSNKQILHLPAIMLSSSSSSLLLPARWSEKSSPSLWHGLVCLLFFNICLLYLFVCLLFFNVCQVVWEVKSFPVTMDWWKYQRKDLPCLKTTLVANTFKSNTSIMSLLNEVRPASELLQSSFVLCEKVKVARLVIDKQLRKGKWIQFWSCGYFRFCSAWHFPWEVDVHFLVNFELQPLKCLSSFPWDLPQLKWRKHYLKRRNSKDLKSPDLNKNLTVRLLERSSEGNTSLNDRYNTINATRAMKVTHARNKLKKTLYVGELFWTVWPLLPHH